MKLQITLSDVYQAYRLTKGIREAVKLTAGHMSISAEHVCELLGLDPKYADGPSVDLDITVTVWSKDRGVIRATKDKLHSCLGDPAEVQYTPTRTHLMYVGVKVGL